MNYCKANWGVSSEHAELCNVTTWACSLAQQKAVTQGFPQAGKMHTGKCCRGTDAL